MADDTRLNAGTAGDLIATDELTTINGVAATVGLKVQRVKMGFGTDNVLRDVDAANPLPSVALGNGVISTVNSTAVALIAGAVFTGASEDVTEYADIRITVFADQPSATDGLQMQQSSNGTNWDLLDAYTLPATTGRPFSVAASARFFRIVYTNGATAQTAFRLQVKFHKGYTKGASVRPQDARSRENDMEEMLGYAMHFDGTNWNMQRGSIANGLVVDVSRIVASVAVTGTFFQATQPVSAVSLPLPAGASTEATLAALNTKVTAVNTGAVTISAALPAGANSIGTVQVPAITKGTQGTTGVTTQDLKDAGRVRVSIVFQAATAAVADTLLSLVKISNGAAAAGAVSIGVTAGKVFRITSATLSIKSAAAAAAFATMTFRQNPAGVTAIGSVSEFRIDVGNTAATIGASDKVEIIFPDGMEFSGTQTLGVSLACQAIGNIASISLNGFEY